MKIIVSGLTGSGKSACSEYLAQHLGVPVISGSSVRERLLSESRSLPEAQVSGRERWLLSQAGIEADLDRLKDGKDEGLDERLMQLYESTHEAVFSAWFLAWLVQTPLRVWLETSLETRVDRIAATILTDISRQDLALAVKGKDERARRYGLQKYGVDIFEDRTAFDIVMRNDKSLALNDLGAFLVNAFLSAKSCATTAAYRRSLVS